MPRGAGATSATYPVPADGASGPDVCVTSGAGAKPRSAVPAELAQPHGSAATEGLAWACDAISPLPPPAPATAGDRFRSPLPAGCAPEPAPPAPPQPVGNLTCPDAAMQPGISAGAAVPRSAVHHPGP